MRLLVTTSPGLGHAFPLVGLAWAFRAAGHEVLFATAGRSAAEVETLRATGLHVAEIASVDRITAVRRQVMAERDAEAARLGIDTRAMVARNIETARRAKTVEDGNGFTFALRIYGPMSEAAVDGLVDVGRWYRPDLVVHESLQGAGPLVAALLGVPAVEHPIGFTRGPELVTVLHEHLAGAYERYGVEKPERTAALDISPPSMGIGPEYGRPMRCVPYSGGSVLGPWSRPLADGRPRIAVSLGTIAPQLGLDPFAPVLAAATEVDAEFVVALGGADPAALGDLPPNVHAHSYVSHTALALGCDAIINHGGGASCFVALEAGLPQLVLPQFADQFVTAEAVRRRGCGLVSEDGDVDAGALRRMLGDDVTRAAREVRAEMAGMASPADVVPELVALTH